MLEVDKIRWCNLHRGDVLVFRNAYNRESAYWSVILVLEDATFKPTRGGTRAFHMEMDINYVRDIRADSCEIDVTIWEVIRAT